MRKNCNSCQHLEWVDGEHESDTGFTCNKRHQQMWAAGREQELLSNLDRDDYRDRYKRCFDPNATPNPSQPLPPRAAWRQPCP